MRALWNIPRPSARFCPSCATPVAASPLRPLKRRSRRLAVGVVALFIAAMAGAVMLTFGRDGDGGGGDATIEEWLPIESTGEAALEIDPLIGGTLRVGAASVRIFPGTFSQTVVVSASLATDGTLEIHADPALTLALPARITLPLPPGSAWGETPSHWPVVVGTGVGEPLILQPNTVGPDSLSVDVPHFSSFVPAAWQDAIGLLAKLGKALSTPPKTPKAPGGVEVGMSLPKDYNTDASVGQVRIDVQATTGGPKPEAPPGGATLPAEWKLFEGLNVIVSGYRRMPPNNQLEEVVIANEPLGEGAHRAFDVTLPPGGLWEETNAGQAVLVVKLIEGGKAIVEKSVPAPIGGYWESFACSAGKDATNARWGRFTVYYLKDPNQAGYPDSSYTPGPPAGYGGWDGKPLTTAPARVLDTCSTLTTVYRAFNSAAYFNDAENAPSDEMDVWLQNWDDNNAGAVTNQIVLSVKSAPFEEFRVSAAHELAHRFQHQYSLGLFRSGGWLHDASAEYLAQHVFLAAGESNASMRRFAGGTPGWLNGGLFSSVEADNYAASSFLAFLADTYGMNIAREVWVEGGSGVANLSDWPGHLDTLIKRHAATGSLADV